MNQDLHKCLLFSAGFSYFCVLKEECIKLCKTIISSNFYQQIRFMKDLEYIYLDIYKDSPQIHMLKLELKEAFGVFLQHIYAFTETRSVSFAEHTNAFFVRLGYTQDRNSSPCG